MTGLWSEHQNNTPRAFPHMQNRELSWLRFNERVLAEAANEANPLLERFNFLSIFTTNLDEFFMVRVGSLMDYMRHDPSYSDNKTGMTAAEQLDKIYAAVKRLYQCRDDIYFQLESEFEGEGARKLSLDTLTRTEERLLDEYFDTHLHPVLSPQIVDASHPFPHIENKRLVAAFTLEGKNRRFFAMIPLPQNVERVYTPGAGYILLEDVILKYGKKVFPNYHITETAAVSITRNADIATIRDIMDENEDFREHMSKLLQKRKRLEPVRLEVCGRNCENLTSYLQKRLALDDAQTFFTRAPINLGYRPVLPAAGKTQHQIKSLNFAPFEPAQKRGTELYGSVMRRLRQGDILLLHPFESVQPFISLLKEASEDRYVSSIRITLYRIAEQSKIIEHLIAAAESGKDVSVFI
ncbi:MAG: RNA degradosome polyphosphate kinase, partial [Gracilibacteraceae bacterium]|nr:RNA degradosome polyphosphate kinase [Gracilibacteraceae bacterium]